MLDRYQDMLDLPRPPSPSHAPMRRRDRAAQFAPFAALTGFDEQIRKVAWMQRSAFPYEGKGYVIIRSATPQKKKDNTHSKV